MVLESLVSADAACRRPWLIAALGAVFASIAVAIVFFLNLPSPDLMAVLLTIIPAVPFVLNLFNKEEVDAASLKWFSKNTLARHSPTILVLVMLFVGFIAAFTFWNLALPQDASQRLFAVQNTEVARVQQAVSGFAVNSVETAFEVVFFHNLGVLGIALGFSLLYGAGTVFVLVWNASVIAAFLASLARQAAGQGALSALALGAAGVFPHGLFELLAYSTAALAGGILSRSVIVWRSDRRAFTQVVYDVAKLVSWAIIFLAVAAFLETYAIA